MPDNHPDILVIGGGIVGCATAYRLSQLAGDCSMVLIEKEKDLALHQTGRNSGVMHSGIYYRPGSSKAQNCLRGKAALENFCREEGLPFETCGKVIVATEEWEIPQLQALAGRARANGVQCRELDGPGLRELEPYARGESALHVPATGMVDYKAVTRRLAERFQQGPRKVCLGMEVKNLQETAASVRVQTSKGRLEAGLVINCGGLQSDRLARLCGLARAVRIVPFRGEYFKLAKPAEIYCRNLIYPVPNPDFPFLGVHFTRMIGGAVECGPNAVLAFGREAYAKGAFSVGDLADVLSYPGFWRMAAKYWRMGLSEMHRSWSKKMFLKSVQRLVSQVQDQDLSPAPCGIRAQALASNGQLIDDFVVERSQRTVHVLNAPSPAATACLSIGQEIAETALAIKK